MPRGSERVPCEMNYTFVRERTDCGGMKELKTKMHFQDKQEPIKAIKIGCYVTRGMRCQAVQFDYPHLILMQTIKKTS